MFVRIVGNRRVAVERDYTRVTASADDRPRNARWRDSCRHRRIGKRFPRRRFHYFPSLPCAGGRLLRNRATCHREHSLRQVDRLFASNVLWMRRHEPQQTGLRADENAGHRTERRNSVKPSAETKPRRPPTSKKRIKHPAAIVIRQPAPRLRPDERPAKHSIHQPPPPTKSYPPQPHPSS